VSRVKWVQWVQWVLLAWLVLVVPLVVLVGRAIKGHAGLSERQANREQAEILVAMARQADLDPKVIQVPLDRWGQPVSRENTVHPVRMGQLVRKAPWDQKDRWGLWDRKDLPDL
jgi:hypothetical protein